MQVDGKTLTVSKALWVQHGGVDVAERGDRLVLMARDEDAYLKVLNHFGRVLKLYTFEGERWVDTDTGTDAQPFDESQAGRLPAAPTAPPGKAPPAAKRSAPPSARAAAAPARKPAAKATHPKSARPKPARSAAAGSRGKGPGPSTRKGKAG